MIFLLELFFLTNIKNVFHFILLMSTLKYVAALVTVEDIAVSRQFYEKILGLRVTTDYGENVTFNEGFSIHKKSHFASLVSNLPITSGGNNFELYFEYDDIDQLQVLLEENNVQFVHKCIEQPWRQKGIRFYDPDHNMIEVGEPLPHVAKRLLVEGNDINTISQILMTPKEIIEIWLK